MINPYESPAALPTSARPEVGVWKDGDLLVMHVDAELPRLCVVTGQVAAGAREQQFVWRPPDSVLLREKTFWLPVCRAELEAYRRQRVMSFVGLLLPGVAFIGLLLVIPLTQFLAGWGGVLLVLVGAICGLGGLMWLVYSFQTRSPLRIVHSAGDNLWFAGAHAELLQTLPDWAAVRENKFA